MKIAAACVLIVAAVASIAAARQAGIGPFSNSLPTSLPAPHGLVQETSNGHVLIPGQWTHEQAVRLSVPPSSAKPKMRLQIELAQNGAEPLNHPNATGAPGQGNAAVTISNLSEASYRWWARYFDGSAISPWVPFSGGPAFRVDTTPPTAPVISSSTDPVQGKVYRSGTVALSWSSSDSGSGVSKYRYSLSSVRPTAINKSTSLKLTGLKTGTYTLSVSAKDRAGNWSPVSSYRIRLDSTVPIICPTCYGFSRFSFNPRYTPMTFNYRLNEPATVRIGIYSQSTNRRVRLIVQHAKSSQQILHYDWHGRDDHGNLISPGMYSYVVRLTDAYGNTNVYTYSNLQVIDKVIIVSLTQQRLWAYQDGHVMMTSLVTTGNINCCKTPPGLYTVLASFHPFTFRSPAPVGTFYYYPPSPVTYALLFQTRGFYIHDAPWRTVFGPGTNTVPGIPGSPETGSHGCVNTPLAMAAFLYGWAPVGTPVKVLN